MSSDPDYEDHCRAALDYVAADMLLHNRKGGPESIVEMARKTLSSSSEYLSSKGYIPHLSKNIPPELGPADYLVALSGISDVLIPHGKDDLAIKVLGSTASERCRILYLVSR